MNFAVLLFYYAVVADAMYTIYLLSEFVIQKANGNTECSFVRIFCYDMKQYFILIIVSMLNTVAKTFQTIAQQYDKSVFVSLCGY